MSVPQGSTIIQLQSVKESPVTFADLNTSCPTQQFLQKAVLFLPDDPVLTTQHPKESCPLADLLYL